MTLVTAGRVGRAHGLDGSFHVDEPAHELALGTAVVVEGQERRVERRAGTDVRPLLRLSGVADRKAAAALHGELLLVEGELAEGEWLAADLIGCEVEGLGTVRKLVGGPSCDVLELDDGTLVPLVTDAIVSIDVDARRIRADLDFLGRA